MIASPMPSSVPDSPTWSAIDAPGTIRPNPLATSPSAAEAPYCPKPDASATKPTATIRRSVQP